MTTKKLQLNNKTAPKLDKYGKGTESIKFIVSNVSKDVRDAIVPTLFPILGAHISNTEFLYCDNSWKETCGQIALLAADSGGNKNQLTRLANILCRDFVAHDTAEYTKLAEWNKMCKTKKANQPTPPRPNIKISFPPSDISKPAFLQNAMAHEASGGTTQYLNLPEIEMADSLCGGHRNVSVMFRNIYDGQRAGALRATSDGVSGDPVIRACVTIASTVEVTQKYFKYDLTNGLLGRVTVSYKPRTVRDGKIPRQGTYSDEFYAKVDELLERLTSAHGRYIVKPLNKLIDKLAQEMADLAEQTDDDVLWDYSKRSLVSAWKAGCILWLLNNQTWTKAMGDLVEWLVYHDIWSKVQVFGEMIGKKSVGVSDSVRRGPRNLLEAMPDSFNQAQLEAMRESIGKDKEGANAQLRQWVHRKFVTFSMQTGMYTKTAAYLSTSASDNNANG